jgi:hypothetical protein
MVPKTDIAWLAGIIDGEGSISCRLYPRRKTSVQTQMILCNTSKSMIDRVVSILDDMGIGHGSVRVVDKDVKQPHYKAQYWVEVARKHELLKLLRVLAPHLTAKHYEAVLMIDYLKRKCAVKAYKHTVVDRDLVPMMQALKRSSGEPLPEVVSYLRGQSRAKLSVDKVLREGVETRSVSSNNNPTHERPAP